MNRKIQEILNKIVGDLANLKISIKHEKVNDNNAMSLDALDYVYLHILDTFNVKNTEYCKKELSIWLYLKPEVIFDRFNIIDVKIKDIIYFTNWYITNFILFYKNPNNKKAFVEKYKVLIATTNEGIEASNYIVNNRLNGFSIEMKMTSEKEKLSEKEKEKHLEDFFDSLKSIVIDMEKYQKKDIFYANQLGFLKYFDINDDLIEQIKLDIIKNAKHEEIDESKVEKKEKNEKIELPKISLGKTISEKEENERKRALFEEMNHYYKDDEIIKDEDYEKILIILGKLYTPEEASQIKNNILVNNQRLKQIRYDNTKQELLSVDNNIFMDFITNVFYQNDIRYFAYFSLIQNTLNEVSSLINEYILLEDNDKLSLKEVYQEQINLSLDTLKEYGLNIPDGFFDTEARR